jgi:hypothetical protein
VQIAGCGAASPSRLWLLAATVIFLSAANEARWEAAGGSGASVTCMGPPGGAQLIHIRRFEPLDDDEGDRVRDAVECGQRLSPAHERVF